MDKIYLPDWIADNEFHKVRADWRNVYKDHPKKPGIKLLIPGARKVIEEGEAAVAAAKAELAATEAEGDRKIAEQKAELVRIQTAAKNARIDNRLERAFKEQGVNVHFIRIAISSLKNQYEFDVVPGIGDEYSVTATITATGYSTSAEYAVEDFLDSEEGAGIRPKPRARSDGMFTAQLAALKSLH